MVLKSTNEVPSRQKLEEELNKWNLLGYVLAVNNKKIVDEVKNCEKVLDKTTKNRILWKCLKKQEIFNRKRQIAESKIKEEIRVHSVFDAIEKIEKDFNKRCVDGNGAKLTGLKLMKFQWAFYINHVMRIVNEKYFEKVKPAGNQSKIEKNLKKLASFGAMENYFRACIFREFLKRDLSSSKLTIFVAIESLQQLHE